MTSTTWRVWLRRNLFRNLRDGIITLLTAFIAGWILWKVLRFVLITGRWEIVERNLALFMYGRYPREDLWRITLALCVAAFVTTMLFSMWSRADRAGVKRSPRTMLGEIGRRWWPLIVLGIVLLSFVTTVGPWIAACAAIACLFAGALLGRALSSAPVRIRGSAVAVTMLGIVVLLWFLADGLGWDDWGGLMLSLYLAAGRDGLVLSARRLIGHRAAVVDADYSVAFDRRHRDHSRCSPGRVDYLEFGRAWVLFPAGCPARKGRSGDRRTDDLYRCLRG